MVRSIAIVAALVLGGLGCSMSLEPGLANAPRLGASVTHDDRVTDVISNGNDACGRAGAEGTPLRHRWPRCPQQELVRKDVKVVVHSNAVQSRDDAFPWLSGRYLRWPCVGTEKRRTLVDAADAAASTTNAPLACSSAP